MKPQSDKKNDSKTLAAKKTKSKTSRHILSDHVDYVNAIGMVSLETVDLELELAHLFARMLGISLKLGRSIYMSPKAELTRLDIFQNTAEEALSLHHRAKKDSALSQQKIKALQKIKNLLHRSRELIVQRHRVIHDEWDVEGEEKEVRRLRLDGVKGREYEKIPKANLEDHVYKIRALIDDTYDLALDFRKHPPLMVDMGKPKENLG
jgi:hypothetical protein